MCLQCAWVRVRLAGSCAPKISCASALPFSSRGRLKFNQSVTLSRDVSKQYGNVFEKIRLWHAQLLGSGA